LSLDQFAHRIPQFGFFSDFVRFDVRFVDARDPGVYDNGVIATGATTSVVDGFGVVSARPIDNPVFINVVIDWPVTNTTRLLFHFENLQ